jgi:hypothetical protein
MARGLRSSASRYWGKDLPTPVDTFGQRGAGDVFDALHELDQKRLLSRAHRGEADAAVAHDHRGDPVPAGRRQVGIPGGLAVVVGVHVDPAWRHQLVPGVDLAPAAAGHLADGDDAAVVYGDVTGEARTAGAVDDGAVANDQIVHVPLP